MRSLYKLINLFIFNFNSQKWIILKLLMTCNRVIYFIIIILNPLRYQQMYLLLILYITSTDLKWKRIFTLWIMNSRKNLKIISNLLGKIYIATQKKNKPIRIKNFQMFLRNKNLWLIINRGERMNFRSYKKNTKLISRKTANYLTNIEFKKIVWQKITFMNIRKKEFKYWRINLKE